MMLKIIITESNIGDLPTIALLEYFCLNCNTYRDVWVEGPHGQTVHSLMCKKCDQTIARGKIPDDLFKKINQPGTGEKATEFVFDQIRLLHEYFHKDRDEEGDFCLPDPSLLICHNCKKYSFEAKRADDEHDTYLWVECRICKYQHGVSH